MIFKLRGLLGMSSRAAYRVPGVIVFEVALALGTPGSDVGENAVQGPGYLVQIHGAGQQARVAVLIAGPAAHEAAELVMCSPAPLGGLALQGPQRPELALRLDDSFHRAGPERPDQLVLQVEGAHEESERLHRGARCLGADPGSPQHAPEVVLLGSIAQTGQLDVKPARTIPLQIAPEVSRAAHRDDGDAVRGEVTAAPPGQHLKRDAVTQSLNQNDRPRPAIEGRIRDHIGNATVGWFLAGCRAAWRIPSPASAVAACFGVEQTRLADTE